MGLITSNQVWRQRKGHVRVRIVWFCKAGQCTRRDERSLACFLMNHVHVVGWHEVTMVATNHTVIRAHELTRKWDLIN